MNDRSIADLLALLPRLTNTAEGHGWVIDPEGEIAVARRLRLWLLGAVVFWTEIGTWFYGVAAPARLGIVMGAIALVVAFQGARRVGMRRSLPSLYHGFAIDILFMLGDETDIPLPEVEIAANRAIVLRLIKGAQRNRLTEEHAAAVVSFMGAVNVRSARILHAHLLMMLEAEACRNAAMEPTLHRYRETASGLPTDIRSRSNPAMGIKVDEIRRSLDGRG